MCEAQWIINAQMIQRTKSKKSGNQSRVWFPKFDQGSIRSKSQENCSWKKLPTPAPQKWWRRKSSAPRQKSRSNLTAVEIKLKLIYMWSERRKLLPKSKQNSAVGSGRGQLRRWSGGSAGTGSRPTFAIVLPAVQSQQPSRLVYQQNPVDELRQKHQRANGKVQIKIRNAAKIIFLLTLAVINYCYIRVAFAVCQWVSYQEAAQQLCKNCL